MDISHKLELLVNSIINYMLIVIAIGTVAMSLVEFLKSVFMLKRQFNQLMFMKWLGVKDKEKPQSDIYKEFYSVVVGEEKSLATWFNQSTDKIFPHLHTAAQLVVEYKEIYPKLFKFFAGNTPQKVEENNARSDASISHFVSSRVEVFRLSLDFKWEKINQTMALLFAIGLTFALGMDNGNELSLDTGYLIFLGVMSGLFAPVAKDLVSALITLQFRR